MASCSSNPFKGRLVRVGIQPNFEYVLPGRLFGKPTAGSMVQVSKLLASKYGFSLSLNFGPSGSFSQKTGSFTDGSHLRVSSHF